MGVPNSVRVKVGVVRDRRFLSMAKQIFVSYGREQEVQAFVIRLKHDLERNGFTVWLDIEDIPAGASVVGTNYRVNINNIDVGQVLKTWSQLLSDRVVT